MTPDRDSRPRAAPAAPSRKPRIIDTLLQSATVGVFHACGVAAAPLEPLEIDATALELDYPVGVITFRSPGINASLVLSLPRAVCARLDIAQRPRADLRDILCELTNQVMGRLKNRLALYQVTVSSGLPICRDRRAELDSVIPKSGTLTLYRFRTLDGSVVLALKGDIDESRLVYSSTVQVNAEGDIILF